MSFLGADTDELAEAGKKCEEGAQTADEVIQFLKALVMVLRAASFFTGGASAAYATYLETVVIPWLQKVSAALHLFAKVLNSHADAQNKASAGESVDLGSLPTYQTPGGLPAGDTSSYPPIVAPQTPGQTPGQAAGQVPAGSTGGSTVGTTGGGVTTTIAPDGTTTVHVDPSGPGTGTTTGDSTGGTPVTAAHPLPTVHPTTGGAAPVYSAHPASALGGGSGGGTGSGVGGSGDTATPTAGGAGTSGTDSATGAHAGVQTGGGLPGGSPAVHAATTYSGEYQPGDPSGADGNAATGGGTGADGGGLKHVLPTAGAAGAVGALGLGGAALAAQKGAANGTGAINGLIDANGSGSRGEDVRQLQQKLSDAGYDTHGVDGAWGPKTQAAVDAYRAANPVPVTPGEGHFSPTGYDYNKITGAAKADLSPEFYRRVEQVAANVGTKPEYLMGVMSAETNGHFSTSIQNPHSTATGLIQFTSDTAHGLGTSTAELRTMTPVQQLDYVEKYLAPHRGHLSTVEGLYSTVLSGHTVENPDGVLLTRGAHDGYEGNHYLDQRDPATGSVDGRITSREAADSIRARIRR